MAEQVPTAVRVEPGHAGTSERTWNSRWRRPTVHRRTFSSDHGVSHYQWGIYDPHGTWIPYPDQEAAFAAAFGEHAA